MQTYVKYLRFGSNVSLYTPNNSFLFPFCSRYQLASKIDTLPGLRSVHYHWLKFRSKPRPSFTQYLKQYDIASVHTTFLLPMVSNCVSVKVEMQSLVFGFGQHCELEISENGKFQDSEHNPLTSYGSTQERISKPNDQLV